MNCLLKSKALLYFKNNQRIIANFLSTENIIIERINNTGKVILKLNQPPVNSLNGELLTNISDEIKKLYNDESSKGVLITSNFNGKVFSAGLNILDMYNKSDAYLDEFWRCVQQWYIDVYGFAKPIISVINGHAPAGGCVLALMSDYRVMMMGKNIGLNETQLGLVAPPFFVELLISAVGERRAEYALNLGAMFSSEEALKVGIVDDVCPLDDVRKRAEEELEKFITISPVAFASNKRIFRGKKLEHLRDNRDDDVAAFIKLVQNPRTQFIMEKYLENLKRRS